MNDLLLFALNGGGWSLSHILEKYSIDKFGPYQFLLIKFMIGGIIVTPLFIYCYYNNKVPKLYKDNILKEAIILGIIATLITLLAISCLFILLSKYGPAFVIPISQSISLLLTTLLSVIILGEKVTIDMLMGVFFIIVGICFIYRNKSKIYK